MASKPPRTIRVEGSKAFVPLTRGYEAIIDAEDVHMVEGYNWRALVQPHTVYAHRTTREGGVPYSVRLHRVIARTPQGIETDHIDGNGLNNVKSNLRWATPSENQRNHRVYKNNTSGYKGVSYSKKMGKWRADINVNRRRVVLGYFPNKEAAHAAYCEASRRLHGDFGRVA